MGDLADEGRRCNAGLWFLWSWKLSCPSLSLSLLFLTRPSSASLLSNSRNRHCCDVPACIDFLPSEVLDQHYYHIYLAIFSFSLVLSLTLFPSSLLCCELDCVFSYLCFSNVRAVRCSDSWLCGCIWIYLWLWIFWAHPLCSFLCDRCLLSGVNIYVASSGSIHPLLSLSAVLFIPLYLMIPY